MSLSWFSTPVSPPPVSTRTARALATFLKNVPVCSIVPPASKPSVDS